MRRLFVAAAVTAFSLGAAAARAQGAGAGGGIGGTGEIKNRPDVVEEDLIGTPRDIRTAPRAPTLPDLTHRAPELSLEQTIASVKPKGATGARLTSHLFHLDFELPAGRFLYLGAEWGFAAARGPGAVTAAQPDPPPVGKFVVGQPQLFARVVKTLDGDRYAVGAGLGLIAPVVVHDTLDDKTRIENATASSLVSIVRPWDLSTFLDRRVTLRPWLDLRAKNRRFVVQFRQGIDVGMRTGASTCSGNVVCDRAGDIQLLSISTLYLGWQPTRELSIGLEAWEVYLLKTSFPIADRDRSAFALSPSVRWFYRWVEPAVSVLFPVGKPLLNSVDSYFAMRIDLRVWFGGR